ncbi:MAG: diaminopimelate dehydrogenase [Firmicutes bacterium]|nr:diaminopimelate dehydrogenase [Bacillota bacterium]
MSNYKVAVVGCGNVGKNAANAVLAAPDMELTGIVEQPELCEKIATEFTCPVVDNLGELANPDGVLLCLPSILIPQVAPMLLRQGIATADSFDIHGQPLLDMLDTLEASAKEGGAASVSAAGWDPGTDSVIRAIFEIIAPQGITHTNFGPGMSMGHTVAAKAINGVRDALSMTIPKGLGIHDRHVYVELETGADFKAVKDRICTDPYFINDKTTVSQVERVSDLLDMGHGVHMQRHGVASGVHNQCLDYSCRITNPAVTAQVMVAGLRGALRQQPGAYVMLDLPLLDFLPGERKQVIKELC